MAKRIEDAMLDFYDSLLAAAKKTGDRNDCLANADMVLERLKHYIRLSKDMGLFSLRQYEYAAAAIVEIGRMLGGWMKKCKAEPE